ncbi:hypothetical protein [Echinicola sp. 20G]|uniref:hypothetical protein n=1 Tax=Echinicola sp. 20G TaxID=2781961 RepID=UPI0019100DE7|nr:hypothetical protein [Echinicola sp. 20G]
MGYMGFGMRKEDYKRKPKEALTRYKEVYGNDYVEIDHDPNAPQLSREEVLNKSKVRGLFEWKGFLLLKIIALLIISFVLFVKLLS